jgi:hypothetical protein
MYSLHSSNVFPLESNNFFQNLLLKQPESVQATTRDSSSIRAAGLQPTQKFWEKFQVITE